MSVDDTPGALEPTPPPTRRRRTALTATYAHTPAAQAITALEAAMGGREKLVEVLLHVEPSDDGHSEALTYVMGLVADPRHAKTALAELCRRGGITVGELLAAYKVGSLAKMQVALIARAEAAVPGIVADIYARAQPHYLACETCQGTGSLTPEPTKTRPNPEPAPCRACGGTGQRLIQPELARQELALELAKLTPQKAPLIQQNHLNVRTPGGGVSFAQVVTGVDAALHPRRAHDDDDVIDAEPTEPT